MKQYFLSIIIFLLLVSCRQNSDEEIRKEVLSIAEDYITGNLSDTTKIVLGNGTMIIGSDRKTYVIDPEQIFIGYIDTDTKKDAIISLFPFLGNKEVTTEHLFLINSSGRMILTRSLESDMKILNIEKGVITAEIPEHPRNNPLFGCPSCREVVYYRFIDGELEKIDK